MGVFVNAQNVLNDIDFKTGRGAGNFGESKLKKVSKKIFINQFFINYQLVYMDSEQTSEGVYHGSTKSSITVGFEGITENDLQTNTDKIYSEYITKLKNDGFEIITADEAKDIKLLQDYKMVKGGELKRAQKLGYGTTAPTDHSYFIKSITKKGKEKMSFLDKKSKISSQLGDVIVVNVVITIPFMADGESTGSKLLTGAVGGISKNVAMPFLRISSDPRYTNTSYAWTDKTVVHMPLKDEIVIADVFEKEKFKAIAGAKANTSYDMGIHRIVVSEDVTTTNVQIAKCDIEKYKKGIYEASSLFIDKSTDNFLDLVNGKK